MPIDRKQQLLAKRETTEGGGATFLNTDAIQVFEPSISGGADVQSRVPAGPTLSRDFEPVGRRTRQLSFRSDFRGSGSTGTAPDFARLLEAAGYKLSTLRVLTLGAVTSTVGGFQVGEIVSQSSGAIRGVVVAALSSANAPKSAGNTSGDKLVVAVIVGTFTAAATTGESSGSTSTASVEDAYTGFGYQPTSEKLIQFSVGSWTGTQPVGAGEVIAVESGGAKVGSVQITATTGSPIATITGVLLYGSIANGNTVRSAANGTATLSADPTMIATPSMAFRHNLDGRNRLLLGSRGDFTLEGEPGEPMQFQWTFSGDPGTDADAQPIATSGLSTVRAPRLLGAIVLVGVGSAAYPLTTKRVSLANGGTVNQNLASNRPGGSTGSNVTDRDLALNVTFDNVNGAFDWESFRDAGTPVRFAIVLGTVQGNMLAIVAPVCQVTECTIGKAEGVSTFEVTMRPRRVRESGDDEIYLVQL